MPSPIIGLRLKPEMLERLDAVRGGVSRSDYVRGLIEASLDGGVNNPRPKKEKVSRPAVPREVSGDGFERVPERWRNDARTLVLSVLAVPMRQSEAKAAMGWLPERFEKVLDLCLEAGLIERDDEGRFVGAAG